MTKGKRWSVSDELWEKVESLIPPSPGRAADSDYERRPGGGRKPMQARQAFEAILYVLRTKTQWKALPRRFGSSSAVHSRFKYWEKCGFFHAIWQAGLAEHDGMEGIAWEWVHTGIIGEPTPDSGFATGNPGIGKKSSLQSQHATQRIWRPAGLRRRRR